MSNVIELAKKCGFTDMEIKAFKQGFNTFYEAVQKEQIEKDAKICEQRSDEHAKGKCHSDWIRWSEADYCTEEIRNQLSKENDR